MSCYRTDLACVHDAAFGDYARRTGPEIVRLLRRRGIRAGTVVELGCGSGITAAHLVAHGFDVYGIDISRAMIRLARARAPAARFRVGSIWSARIPRCVAVVAMGEVVSYADEAGHDGRRFAALARRVRESLARGGLFVFDFIESADGRTYRGNSYAGAGWAMTVSATTDRTGRWLTRRMTLVRHRAARFRRSQETHRVRLFDRQEVSRALAAAGMTVRFQRALGRVRVMTGDLIAVARRR